MVKNVNSKPLNWTDLHPVQCSYELSEEPGVETRGVCGGASVLLFEFHWNVAIVSKWAVWTSQGSQKTEEQGRYQSS